LTYVQERVRKLEEELVQAQRENTAQVQKLNQTQTELAQKQEQLKKTRLELVSLESRLKNMPRPEPELNKPIPGKSKPIDPLVLGIILIIAVGTL
jgi:septal ring factor EnvC (AmiA/AmiB activator)